MICQITEFSFWQVKDVMLRLWIGLMNMLEFPQSIIGGKQKVVHRCWDY